MVPLFADYETDGYFDQMFEEPERPRESYERLFAGLRSLRPSTVAERSASTSRRSSPSG